MRLNWISYSFDKYDGYGRYCRHSIRALTRLGVEVMPIMLCALSLPGWLRRLQRIDWTGLTISCIPPYMLQPIPGRQWALSMTEGTLTPPGWAETINGTCERCIVPCEHNREAFEGGGVTKDLHVIPGGTSPEEFPVTYAPPDRPYTFLAMGDRGARKGWMEVWEAFCKAFGSQKDTKDVRLIVKTRPHTNNLLDRISGATGMDRRVSFWLQDVENMSDLYAQVDCLAIPSRSEGWGMPHREAAMMGVPVIATRYSGLENGIDNWATKVIENYEIEDVPKRYEEHIRGEWARPSVDEIAAAMRWCYENKKQAKDKALQGAQWLRDNQTWTHSMKKLLELIERYS